MERIESSKSLSRLLRQLCFIPILQQRWLTAKVKDALHHAITQAEIGHSGEIYVIIENHLPISDAYRMGCRERALSLFASHHVWDTEDNTGVLIYVNACEHDLEIIADRGIDRAAMAHTWQALSEQAITAFREGKMQDGLTTLIAQVGDVLRAHYPSDDRVGNELPNDVVFLK
ncbi:hypothetical protein B0181_09815 [Moraxella caviae]|uniref:Domain of uncharacterized function (DUF477) n=1 Tax=Moraxella caviae TaxID=34060 RepID=A0A1S9ZW38_9GAMM|nr:TPM domain-containing protein [Moraxella caviae]OOR87742.1 hypothetical protein B0181_09815 [Moraxella caviae]STZ10154.1 Domain of uncharacterised function (DUF477) [Moraxella caviae]